MASYWVKMDSYVAKRRWLRKGENVIYVMVQRTGQDMMKMTRYESSWWSSKDNADKITAQLDS